VGGSVAAAHSWPAMALVIFSFSGTVQINGLNYRVNTSSMCGGTLIAKTSVLTAAHCVKTSFKYTLSGRTYTYNFETSDDVPSYYTIYLGAQNINNLDDPSIIKAKVNRITKVIFNYNSNKLILTCGNFNFKKISMKITTQKIL
jgi:V8-like Glu-specific endopeptidase